MLRILLSLITVLICAVSFAQEGYWQQEVNYQIEVKLNDKTHELQGAEVMEYINNSPNELSFIYMHLWPNAYSSDESAMAKQLYENGELDFYYSEKQDRGFIDSIDFKVDNETVRWELDSTHVDIAKIYLNKPLKSGEKVTISTPFHVKIPLGIYSRLGHMGESYQITQWYPKPAVYDKNGWNQMPYLTQGEFYSEFGSYDVSITLPENYVLGATGDLIDGEDELAWLNEKVLLTEAKTSYDDNMDFPESSEKTKTLRFKQNNVHDFAWFADKRYHVLKGEVELPHSKEKVTTWAMFTNSEADLWTSSIEYINDAIYYYSLWNGDYPYKHCTAVDGALSAGAGMEYPNITVIGKSGSAFLLETVIMHEVGHNWFYGILGSNERMHPWMDEGLNSFNEKRYTETKHPDVNIAGDNSYNGVLKIFDMAQHLHKEQYYIGYQIGARKDLDQPIEFPSADYTYINYGTIVYGKSAVSFDYLMAYLGEQTMDKAMQKYFDTWKFKHPQPEDLRKILEEESEKELTWFFDDLLNTTKKLDYKIISAKQEEATYQVKIKNTGEINGPYSICGIKDDSILVTKWFEGVSTSETVDFPSGDYDKLRIDYQLDMPENKRKNNTLKTKGLFKKCEPLKLQFLVSLENPDKTQLFFTPTIGWNSYDKTMIGLAFYNAMMPQKNLEYAISPMYSFTAGEPVGSGFVNFNFLPKSSLLRQISIGVSGQRYHMNFDTDAQGYNSFQKISPRVDFFFKKKKARSTISHQLTIKGIQIMESKYTSLNYLLPAGSDPAYGKGQTIKSFGQAIYSFQNHKTLNPFDANITAEVTNDFAKISGEANFQFDFKKEGKEVKIRLFAGSFLFNESIRGRYKFRLDGISGYNDYTYDHVYLGRNENTGAFNQQFAMGYGGFKTPTTYSGGDYTIPYTVGSSSKWLVAININADIPIGVPIGVFIDVGYGAYDGATVQYDFGLYVSVLKDVAEIYFPVAWSKDIENAQGAYNTSYGNLIRFILHIEKINPFQLLRDFEF
ncbi:MAG: M1 family metallopeptidase [Flavobacteriales bacterium]|nr:M1 family metallopeptidase [Flavobacteriales bacterium]